MDIPQYTAPSLSRLLKIIKLKDIITGSLVSWLYWKSKSIITILYFQVVLTLTFSLNYSVKQRKWFTRCVFPYNVSEMSLVTVYHIPDRLCKLCRACHMKKVCGFSTTKRKPWRELLNYTMMLFVVWEGTWDSTGPYVPVVLIDLYSIFLTTGL